MRGMEFLDSLAEGLDLPGEALPGQTIIEIAGENRLLLENHLGVLQYSREKICVKVKYGQVSVCGCGLELTRMTKHQIVICGRIDGIALLRGRK